MNWRTDKPTADVIVAKLKDYKTPHVLTSFLRGHYQDEDLNEIELKEIEKWADLEEDETPTPEEAMSSLDEKIKSAKKSWEGVDADEYMDEVRGREEIIPNIELIQKSWYRQGYIDGINKQEPQWILENLKYKENPKYGQPLETVTDCHQLDEAARTSWFNYEFDCGALYSKCYKDGFKAGAGWQREQFHDACYQCEKAYDNVFYRGEQHAIKMMKEEATEATVYEDAGGYPFIPAIEMYDYDKDEPTAKKGDKVKVIILKDE